jgi:hypothetical protein
MPRVRDPLVIWTITRNPKDFPGKYVVHGHDVHAGFTKPHYEPLAVVNSLDEARAALPPGLYNLGRKPDDEPQIVESWV